MGPTKLVALTLIAAATTACAEAGSEAGDGSLRVGLWGQGASGESYALRDAGFEITGNGVDMIISAADAPDGAAAMSTPLPAGEYELELLPGWEVYRGSVGDPMPVQAAAELVTDNPVSFTIADNLTTHVTYAFEVDGDVVPMSDGSIEIDVEFQEDDGVCTTSDYDYLEALGDGLDPVGQGEGWQSFTASRDSMLTLVVLYWEAGSYDGTTIGVYEGVGTSGTLLASEGYFIGDVPVADWVWLGFPHVQLTAGQTYTIAGVGADGWRTESGALPGATSSEGNTFHKTMQLQGLPCE